MSAEKKTLASILKVSDAVLLQQVIVAKGDSPVLDELGDPEKAMRFMQVNLKGSYLFARYAVPSFTAAVFDSLKKSFPPIDDKVGAVVAKIMDAVRGELFNNNIFDRAGECHSHYRDALEAYNAAGGDGAVAEGFAALEARRGYEPGIDRRSYWSSGSRRFARQLLHCCHDPLALFILMPANEDMTPRIYARALASLSPEPRFDKFRRFLERHVSLDEDDHGPATLEWLDIFVRETARSPDAIRQSTKKVLTLLSGGSERP